MAEDFSGRRGECFCGSGAFVRVRVLHKSGEFYVTEFVECCSCGVMYHWPEPADRPTMDMAPARREFLRKTGWLK